jgi:hypothetical protein
MSEASNASAADRHDAAARSHRMAAEMFAKHDDTSAAGHAANGLALSEAAHKASVLANEMSTKADEARHPITKQ